MKDKVYNYTIFTDFKINKEITYHTYFICYSFK